MTEQKKKNKMNFQKKIVKYFPYYFNYNNKLDNFS